MMRMPHNLRKLPLIVGRLNCRFNRKVLILLYHRIFELQSDPWSLSVTPEHFSEHLEILKKNYYPLRLQDFVNRLLENRLPKRSVIITFDDGYSDNLRSAKPLLELFDFPATIFLTTGYIGQLREFWWDELDRIFLTPGTLPETLNLTLRRSNFHWKLTDSRTYTKQEASRYCHWRAGENAPSSRHTLYMTLWKILHSLPKTERRQILDELFEWASVNSTYRPSHRPLTHDEVLEFDEGELIEIGCHTITHPCLAKLSVDLQRQEIQGSKSHLEEILNHSIENFSYPHGNRHDYTTETIRLVQEAGFTSACANFANPFRRNVNRFQLPRIYIEDWNGEEFANQLFL